MELFGLIIGVTVLYVVWKLANTGSARHLQSATEMLCATANVTSTQFFDEASSKYDADKIKELKSKANSLLD